LLLLVLLLLIELVLLVLLGCLKLQLLLYKESFVLLLLDNVIRVGVIAVVAVHLFIEFLLCDVRVG
jgi:hypothetical protein